MIFVGVVYLVYYSDVASHGLWLGDDEVVESPSLGDLDALSSIRSKFDFGVGCMG